ncbi:MAG: IspD/TarI family cytidylyltransferase, partial [Flavobacteriales bacterium]
MSSYSVIITAGGIGKRMNLSLPKQFIVINEKPLLMYTIEKFYHFDPKFQIIITLPDEWKEYWEALIVENKFNIPH